MRVRELMRNPVVFCHPGTNLAEATALMWDHDCGALPVVNDSGKVTGFITDRDICMALGTRNKPASEITVGDVSSRVPRTCGPDDDIHAALRTMCDARVRRLPVVDRAKQFPMIQWRQVWKSWLSISGRFNFRSRPEITRSSAISRKRMADLTKE
jgi:CBS domain-containing protein